MQLKIDVQMPTSSQYEVLHCFARDLYAAFVRQGACCRLLSGNDRLFAVLHDPPDFTIGFNGTLKMEDNSFFCDHVKVPHVSCLVDPPYRFLELTDSPRIIIVCDDQEGCSLLKRRHFDRTLFMSHAASADIDLDNRERIYDIVFLGTSIDPEARKKQWKKLFTPEICKHLEEAAKISLEDGSPSFMSILAAHLDPAANQQAFEEVEMYVKGVDRLQLIGAFADSKVHVFGGSSDKRDWKQLLKKYPNIVVHPPVTYDKAIEVMKQSKIVLNSSIKNKYGAHERIFTAAACGAVVVTNAVPFMQEHFKNGKELLLFTREGLASLEDEIKVLLNDENKRQKIAEAGRKRVMNEHTWDCRAEQLLREIVPMLKKLKKSNVK